MADKRCMRCGLRVGWIGVGVDTALAGIKLFVGVHTGSRALTADALYSIVDAISALLVIGSFKFSRRGPDDDHAYGHGKIEFLGIAAVSVCVAGLAVLILHGAVDDLVAGGHREVHPLAAGTAALAVIACFLVYRYAHCAGTRLNSLVILSHAEHNKADAISSLAVLVSILLSWVGLGVLDPLVAVAEVGHILWVSYRLFRRGVDGLLDARPSPTLNGEIGRIARRVPGVLGVEDVRARRVGATLWIEMRVRVSSQRRMSDVDGIRARVRRRIVEQIDAVGNVQVQVAPVGAASPVALARTLKCEVKR